MATVKDQNIGGINGEIRVLRSKWNHHCHQHHQITSPHVQLHQHQLYTNKTFNNTLSYAIQRMNQFICITIIICVIINTKTIAKNEPKTICWYTSNPPPIRSSNSASQYTNQMNNNNYNTYNYNDCALTLPTPTCNTYPNNSNPNQENTNNNTSSIPNYYNINDTSTHRTNALLYNGYYISEFWHSILLYLAYVGYAIRCFINQLLNSIKIIFIYLQCVMKNQSVMMNINHKSNTIKIYNNFN